MIHAMLSSVASGPGDTNASTRRHSLQGSPTLEICADPSKSQLTVSSACKNQLTLWYTCQSIARSGRISTLQRELLRLTFLLNTLFLSLI